MTFILVLGVMDSSMFWKIANCPGPRLESWKLWQDSTNLYHVTNIIIGWLKTRKKVLFLIQTLELFIAFLQHINMIIMHFNILERMSSCINNNVNVNRVNLMIELDWHVVGLVWLIWFVFPTQENDPGPKVFIGQYQISELG